MHLNQIFYGYVNFDKIIFILFLIITYELSYENILFSFYIIIKGHNKELKYNSVMWVPVSLTGKVSDGCIRDLGFNPRLHQKLIGVLVWW